MNATLPKPLDCCGGAPAADLPTWPPERAFVVNLARRPDRLTEFRSRQAAAGWDLPEPEIFAAIDGRATGWPTSYKAKGGAYGCLRSHCSILERCLTDGANSVLVFEDDATWLPDAWDRLARFVEDLPRTWEGVFLGGQHKASTTTVSANVVRVTNCQRTHAYAVRGRRAMKTLLSLWRECDTHIDHWLPRWQSKAAVFAPEPFIFGQAAGRSDILGKEQPARFWSNQTDAVRVVWIDPETNRARVEELRAQGVHVGNWRNAAGHDRGIVEAKGHPAKLRRVVETLLREAPRQADLFVGVWHDSVSFELLQSLYPEAVALAPGQALPPE